MGARLSACLLYAYANLSLKRIQRAEFALGELNASLASAGEQVSEFRAAAAFISFTGTVLLHLPLPEEMPRAESFLPLLPPGLRAFALYVQAHYLYLKTGVRPQRGYRGGHPCHGRVGLSHSRHLFTSDRGHGLHEHEADRPGGGPSAESLGDCRPDDLIEGFGEHHGLLGAMLEAVIKPKWPEDFKKMIDITYRFSSGWRRVHKSQNRP